MDDIYFSDKKKRHNDEEPASAKRIVSDDFLDSDYGDESFELEFNRKGSSQPFSGGNFKVNIPDFDDEPVKPEHRDIYSGVQSRSPQGRRITSGNVTRVPTPRPTQPGAQRLSQQGTQRPVQQPVSRTPQGARVPTRNVNAPAPNHKNVPQGKKKAKKKKSHAPKVVLGIVFLVLILLVGVFFYGYSALGGLNYDDSITNNAYMDESKLISDKSVRNILFIGSDEREGLGGQRSDTMILFSIDKKNHKIKLTSFLRDSYVYIPSKGYNTKLNAAYNYGGAQLLMDTIEYNFGVKIDEYVKVDYEAFIDLVDLLGGITIHDVTAAEAKYMREEVNSKKFKEGTNHIGGRAAMWYCRIRYLDNDFRRTERQRKVLSAIINKATKTNPLTLIKIVEEILPNISTNIDRNSLLTLGMGALVYMHYDIEQQQVPADKTWSNARINGQEVLKMDLDKNKAIIKEFIYG